MGMIVGDIATLTNTWTIDGTPTDPTTVSLTTVTPAGATSTVTYAAAQITREGTGEYSYDLTLSAAGRWVFVWTGTGTAADVESGAFEVGQTYSVLPTLADVVAYLGDHSASDADVQAALDAETAAQRARCRIPADYPDDLAEALKRRVARNLALKLLPLAVLQGDAESGSTVLPGNDPEVRRLEAPHRRLVVG